MRPSARYAPAIVCLLLVGCRPPAVGTSPAPAAAGSVPVHWGPDATCRDEAVNRFVRNAVAAGAAGDYDQYRLLWGIERQPTSRKRFAQLLSAMEHLEVKTLRPVRFRKDGILVPQDQPMYLLHAFLRIKDEAKQRSERLQDRDVVLLVVPEQEHWRFEPAPARVKQAYLNQLAARSSHS